MGLANIWKLGIDPSPTGSHAAALLDGDNNLLYVGLMVEAPIESAEKWSDLIVAIELPEFQGRGWANLLPVYKQASMLIAKISIILPGVNVYTPPPSEIRKMVVGKSTATDAEILSWLRAEGYSTGKGTPFTHNLSHNTDALLAAFWASQMEMEAGDELGDYRRYMEPRI